MLQQVQNGALVFLQPLDFHPDLDQPALEDRGGLSPLRLPKQGSNVRQFQAGAAVRADLSQTAQVLLAVLAIVARGCAAERATAPKTRNTTPRYGSLRTRAPIASLKASLFPQSQPYSVRQVKPSVRKTSTRTATFIESACGASPGSWRCDRPGEPYAACGRSAERTPSARRGPWRSADRRTL